MNQLAPSAESMVQNSLRAGVFTITLNRTEAANAIAPEQRDLIITLLAQASASADVRVVVIQSTGKQFCSGADVSRIAGAGASAPCATRET